MREIETGPRGIECALCDEKFYHKNELVFYSGDVEVYPSEQYPDWSKAICLTCNSDKRRKENKQTT